MISIVVCVGSSCFLRGASAVIEEFEKIAEGLGPKKFEIKGSFCMERCTDGVTVKVGDEIFTAVSPEDVPKIFESHIRPLIEAENAKLHSGVK
ncbi:MAG TPA: (2Fe-2S) ferredoxin domain-containing protein [Firmicutes bacterium]|nr:(2Fe-2S) ferredoxin domain-containing protein [Candidatus Fermentithermobacillaceae bacterium]